MKKQTAVDWLLHQIDKYTSGGVQVPNQELSKLIQKAKQMEKGQIENAFLYGDKNGFSRYKSFAKDDDMTSEEYYNKTYNK